jgi:hypothetical protein
MAGTVTVTQVPLTTRYNTEYNKVKVVWTSDASGNASGPLELYGYLLKVNTDPTSTPTALYDITLLDPDIATGTALDALTGLLADRSGTAGEVKYTTPTSNSVPIFLAGTYTFTVANAGNAKSGTAYFYLVDTL